jgi:threonine synthase
VRFTTERPETWLACSSCGEECLETDTAIRCRRCSGLLAVSHRPPELDGPTLCAQFESRTDSGVWRFREIVMPTAGLEVISHPEGNTPLLSRDAVARWTGISSLLLKHEGHNPTGSFKDRGMTVGMTQAVRVGARGVICASTGNTSASLASYAAHAGIPAFVLVPEGKVSLGKLAQTLGYGARVLTVRGDFDACLALVEGSSESLGLYLLNSVNPWRIEGQKTIVLEMLQQLAWNPPDWIALPGGNLGNTAAFGKALEEAYAWGMIGQVPRLLVVQARGAAPFAQGFAEGFRERKRVQANTVATAIRIGDPASWDRAVRAIRFTDGAVVSVIDDEILAAKRVIDKSGIGCEPASAASIAGIRQLVSEGKIRRDARVVAVLTGHMLKDPEILTSDSGSGMPEPTVIEPTIEALAAAVGSNARDQGLQ